MDNAYWVIVNVIRALAATIAVKVSINYRAAARFFFSRCIVSVSLANVRSVWVHYMHPFE